MARTYIIILHPLCADAAYVKSTRVIRVRHGVDVSDFLCFTHFANGARFSEVLDPDTCPTFMRNTGLRPFAVRRHRDPDGNYPALEG